MIWAAEYCFARTTLDLVRRGPERMVADLPFCHALLTAAFQDWSRDFQEKPAIKKYDALFLMSFMMSGKQTDRLLLPNVVWESGTSIRERTLAKIVAT